MCEPNNRVRLIEKLRQFSDASMEALRPHLPPFATTSAVSFPHCCPALNLTVAASKDCLQTLQELGTTNLSKSWEKRHMALVADPCGQRAKVDRDKLCRQHGQCLCKGDGRWLWQASQCCIAAMKRTFVSGSRALDFLLEGRVVAVWHCYTDGTDVDEEKVRYTLAALHYLRPWRTTWVEMERCGQDHLKVAKRLYEGLAEPKLYTHVDFVATLHLESRWEVSYLLLSSSEAPAVHMARVVVEACEELAVTTTVWRGRAAENQARRRRDPGRNFEAVVMEAEQPETEVAGVNNMEDIGQEAFAQASDSDRDGSSSGASGSGTGDDSSSSDSNSSDSYSSSNSPSQGQNDEKDGAGNNSDNHEQRPLLSSVQSVHPHKCPQQILERRAKSSV